jgi:hypothetical protein
MMVKNFILFVAIDITKYKFKITLTNCQFSKIKVT